jgi:hypothetical protein
LVRKVPLGRTVEDRSERDVRGICVVRGGTAFWVEAVWMEMTWDF